MKKIAKTFETYEKYNGKYEYIGFSSISKDNIIKTKVLIRNGKKNLYVTYNLVDSIGEYKYILDLSDKTYDYIGE